MNIAKGWEPGGLGLPLPVPHGLVSSYLGVSFLICKNMGLRPLVSQQLYWSLWCQPACQVLYREYFLILSPIWPCLLF
jgi:hypothetical protein